MDAGDAFVDRAIASGAEIDDAEQQLARAGAQFFLIGEAFEQPLERRGVVQPILAEQSADDAERARLVDRAVAADAQPRIEQRGHIVLRDAERLDRAGRDAGDDVEPDAAIDDKFMDDAHLKGALRAAAAQNDRESACHAIRLLMRGNLSHSGHLPKARSRVRARNKRRC